MSTGAGGGSWLPRSNSVSFATVENRPSERFGVSPERVERAWERTEEFIEEYPERSQLPLTREPGETLLSSYVLEEYREERVEPEGEFENGFTVERLERAAPVTWAEAFFVTLLDRDKYDMGVTGEFEDKRSGEEFGVSFVDAWTAEYADEQRAKMAGAQRQLMGGEYPEKEESVRSGEHEPGEWERPVSVLWAQTGSSVDGGRVPPVDHARRIDTWESCYHRVRNLIEIKWGVPSGRWGMFRSEDVHGVEDDAVTNAGYTHTHPVVFFDVAEADLPNVSEGQLADIIEGAVLDDVVSKHVEECDLAEWEAHRDSVTVEFELEKPGAYAAGYALPGTDEPLMERSVEYVAWASVLRAMQRQRVARSELFTEAAKADMCKQKADSVHGERLEYDRGGHTTEVVCACCGSSVGVGETMVGHRTSGQAVATDGGACVEELGETVVVGARVGEPSERAEVRERVERWVENNGRPEGVTPAVLGEMGISPEHGGVVSEVVEGVESEGVEVLEAPERVSEESRYELQGLKAWNGDSEEPGVGGARTVEVVLPVEKVLRHTRLQYVGGGCRPKIVVHTEGERFATYNPRTAARALVDAGLRLPWVADRSLSFEHTEREEFEEPVPSPVG